LYSIQPPFQLGEQRFANQGLPITAPGLLSYRTRICPKESGERVHSVLENWRALLKTRALSGEARP
jgi:hypothetical protein